ncbi:MAG: AsmA family protein [Verrucomicrobiota bacterium]
MNKIKKLLLLGGIGAIVLVVAAVIVGAMFLDGIVKKGVETVGPQIVKVPITLNEVHIGLLTGSAKVQGLVIGNPAGYQTPYAISVGLAEVGVNPASVLSDKIVIRSVHVKSPEISFEGNPLGKNNLGDIMETVNAMAKSGGPPATNTTAKAGTKPAQKIEVDDFLISGAKVHVSLTGMGGKEMTLDLPPVHLTDLGKGGSGLTPTDLTRAVLSAVTSATIKAVASAATDLGKGLENLGTGAGKNAGADVNKIKKGLGGLFGK